ncbi:MAG: UxaA family hydrolase [Sphaerochaeta sp.]
MESKAIVIDPKDSVATCIKGAKAGERVSCLGVCEQIVVCVQDIPPYHKIALHAIAKGDAVHKYGQVIGFATEDILQGSWVSDANIHGENRNYETELL